MVWPGTDRSQGLVAALGAATRDAQASAGSAESIAVSSLVAYDIYREYINPEATGEQILFVSRVVIVVFGVFMGRRLQAAHGQDWCAGRRQSG